MPTWVVETASDGERDWTPITCHPASPRPTVPWKQSYRQRMAAAAAGPLLAVEHVYRWSSCVTHASERTVTGRPARPPAAAAARVQARAAAA